MHKVLASTRFSPGANVHGRKLGAFIAANEVWYAAENEQVTKIRPSKTSSLVN